MSMEEMQRCPASLVKQREVLAKAELEWYQNNPTLKQILASQPLNPLRPLEFRVLPLYEQKPS